MGRKAHGGLGSPGEPDAAPPRPRRHPVTLAVGLLLVTAIIGAAAFAAWTLYSDYAWHASAEDAAADVADAVQSFSARDESTPEAVDAVSGAPGEGQVAIADLPYADDIPPEVARIRITPGGALSVLTRSGALCAGVTLDMESTRKIVSGSFRCGEALPPPMPVALRATPFDEAVVLEWPQPPAPVEDYTISFSANDGESWTVVDDGVSSRSRATVQQLANGREYLFRVSAVNQVGESPPATISASPFTEPGPPTNVSAVGGFRAVVSWTPPANDGGRPITGYLVTGEPEGTCTAAADETRCEIADLPAAPGYTFIVRAINEAGAGIASNPATEPIAVYSAPGRAVALSASPGDGVVLLTWTAPLRDGNTPITDYIVEYRAADQEEWTEFEHPASPDTTIAVSGLVNGTRYEFRVLAVNAVGVSAPPLSQVFETPATVPDAVPTLDVVEGNESMALTWTAPPFDGDSPITDYAIQFRAVDGPWTDFDHPPTTGLGLDVTGLENGTSYAFRVAAVNRLGQGAWSPRALGTPVGPPGPVVDPEPVGSLTAIELTWQPPVNDGGRRILGYRVEYKVSTELAWQRLPRVPADETTATVEGLVAGESYDFRILAVNAAGVGPSTQDGTDRPTLSGVIADETPPAPEGLTAVPGDGLVTLRWQASPAGEDSPITAYTVTGDPAGTCTVKRLTCEIRGLTNGVQYSFTVNAANANIVGPESRAVTAIPRIFNAATGGVVTTYTRAGRTFRVHTFTSGSTLTVTSAAEPFNVLVVGGGGGSAVAPDGSVAVGGGGGIINARRTTLPAGVLAVAVGAGGPPGSPGGPSSLDTIGTAPPGAAGSPTQAEFSPTVTSGITGTRITYGGTGTPTSGPGIDGRGTGAGGPTADRGGNGIVIVSYEIAP